MLIKKSHACVFPYVAECPPLSSKGSLSTPKSQSSSSECTESSSKSHLSSTVPRVNKAGFKKDGLSGTFVNVIWQSIFCDARLCIVTASCSDCICSAYTKYISYKLSDSLIFTATVPRINVQKRNTSESDTVSGMCVYENCISNAIWICWSRKGF